MFAKGRCSISVKDIENKVTEEEVLKYYLGINELPVVINSPLRKDNNPSFYLYLKDFNKVRYLDFATGESGGIYDLLSNYWKTSFIDTIVQVYHDIVKIGGDNSLRLVNTTRNKTYKSKGKFTLGCKIREWRDYDIKYWEQYGISLEWLKFSQTFPISRIFIEGEKGKRDLPAEKYAYVYVEHKDNTPTIKIYQPYSKYHKWSNNHNTSVWDLWTQLPKTGERLIITSSRKDALTIWENTGIPACSLQAESYLPKNTVVKQLKSRFDNIYVLYDNDYTKDINYGRIFGEKLASKFDLNLINLPTELKSKDPSDLVKNYGRQKLKEVIHKLIKK